jgi:FecR-like protein
MYTCQITLIPKQMQKKNRIRIFPIFLIMLMISVSSMGNELELIKGKVKIRSKGVDMIFDIAGQKVPIANGDQIQTGRDSQVKIHLQEQGDAIELQSFSIFKVAVGEENIDKMVLPVGKARFKVRKRTGLKKKRFRVRTGNALVGVKGTEWVMSSGGGDTSVLTISGVVSLANILAPDITVDIPLNQASRIEQNKLPTTPVIVPPQVREQVIAADSRNAFGSINYGSVITIPKDQQDKIKKKNQHGQEKQPDNGKKETGTSKEGQGQPGGEDKPAESSGEGEADTADGYGSVDLDEPEIEEPEIDIDDLVDDITEIESEIAEEQATIEIEAIEIEILH